ncbi:unnamed protein product [Phytophthora fragariaefolia]|uniref:Unnamed protein product n=1 Tax=Phytophthora fragariaefolia TaxID=1490495 RepID=A0A9W6XUY7_9STRA|nr:unnamed protein product [Phytophthora fragariaefolia]
MLTDKFERIPIRGEGSRAATHSSSPSYEDRSNLDYNDVPASTDTVPDKLSSILSSYDLQVSSSSSSMARYLASVRSRTLNEANGAAGVSGDGNLSPSQASSTSSQVVQEFSHPSAFGSTSDYISEKEVQKQLGVIYDRLHLDNNWDKRVEGLKMLQKLAKRCGNASNSGIVLPFLSQGLRVIRERLCQQVSDLRSSVSREACQTIQTLANNLRDEFNTHAEICLGNLLKATYDEANGVFDRLDGSTQKNLKDDPSKFAAKTARRTDYSSMEASASQGTEVVWSALRTATTAQPSSVASNALSSVTFSGEQPAVQRILSSGELVGSEKLPRRVLGGSSSSTGVDTTEDSSQPSRMLSQGPMRVGRTKAPVSKDATALANEKKKNGPAGPLRVWNAPQKSSQLPHTTVENLYTSRQEPSTAGFHTSSKNSASKAQRVQRAAEAQAPVPMDIDEAEPSGPKRLPIASMPSPTASASSSRTNNSSKGDSIDVKPKVPRTVPSKPLERPKVAELPVLDDLEEALRNIESSSWSTRLEAADSIGKTLQKCLSQAGSGAGRDCKVDGRILMAFIKHLSDAHYRVSQGVLKNFLPLLKLSNESQRLLPHLKTVLPKLFQKYIDTKESIRVIAKENLDYIASATDCSTLASLVISMLGDGSNMKAKVAMCHYLRDLLPGAGEYMKHGNNYSHMRSFLLKIALLMDTDVPVSVSSACGELVSIAAQLYGPEMEIALGLLPPSKRLVVSKVLKAKKIILNFSNSHRPPLSTTAAPHSARSRDGDCDNQDMELSAPKPERSRKRPESPSVSSSSSARQSSLKRINTTAQVISPAAVDNQTGDRSRRRTPVKGSDELTTKDERSESPALSTTGFTSSTTAMDRCGAQLDDILLLLEQNNLSSAEMKNALYQARHLMERILQNLVSFNSDHQQTLATLVSLVPRVEPPALQVALRLVNVCLQSCERSSPQDTAFLRNADVGERLMSVLTHRLGHESSSVRKNAVDCLVEFYFATKEDSSIVPKFLAAELDDTQRRLVEIFIDRARVQRRHVSLST